MQDSDRLVAMLAGPPQETRLDVGALLVAGHAEPDLDIEQELARLDALAARITNPTLDGLRQLLFEDLGFRGDATDYYNPRNSFLNCVMDRRRGLPISLAVLMIEVGRRAGVPLDGVGMPGHFLVRDRVVSNVFVDPFAGGAVLDRAGCERRFRTLAGTRAPFRDSYLMPVSSHDILVRIVGNVVNAYRRSGDLVGMGWSASLRSRMPGVSPAEKVQLAQTLTTAGRWGESVRLMEEAASVLDGDESEEWHEQADRLRARGN